MLKFSIMPEMDVDMLSRQFGNAATKDYAYPSNELMRIFKGRSHFDWLMALRIQKTYLEYSNPACLLGGQRMKEVSGKISPSYIPTLLTTILPVKVEPKDLKSFRLSFGHTGRAKNTIPSYQAVYDYNKAQDALNEWYRSCISISPLASLNDYVFGTIAVVLHQTLKNDFQKR